MNIDLVVIGKTDADYTKAAIELYNKRINFYTKFSLIEIPDVKLPKNCNRSIQKELEGKCIENQLAGSDFVVLLDEKGEEFDSIQFADWLQKRMNAGVRRLSFVVGGPYGFSESVYGMARAKISLSRMTFSHQIIRTIFTEQLYRAFTIINNEPYHHK